MVASSTAQTSSFSSDEATDGAEQPVGYQEPQTQGRRYSGFWCYPCLGMNRSTKRELKIDIPLAILLALLPLAYENLDLPHSRTLAFITWGVCLLPAARI